MLAPATTAAVLDRLGFPAPPAPDLDGLGALYDVWCRNVPFDNVVKRIHLSGGSPDPIPNGPAEAFFTSYLRHGTGGTCWPSSGALHALLTSVGFAARRGSGAMYDHLSGPVHSHGTVLVRLGGVDYWVDSSMLTRRVFAVKPNVPTIIDDPVHHVRVDPVDATWRVWWTHPFADELVPCLLLDDDVSREHYLARYEWSRGFSPFNAGVYATRNVGTARITIAFGQRFERTPTGVTSRPLGADRTRVLVDEFHYSEAIVAALPADDPVPPRQG